MNANQNCWTHHLAPEEQLLPKDLRQRVLLLMSTLSASAIVEPIWSALKELYDPVIAALGIYIQKKRSHWGGAGGHLLIPVHRSTFHSS